MNTRKLEKIARGFGNHRRIQLLEFLNYNPDQSVIETAEALRVNFKTISEHLRRLALAGLVIKHNHGSEVEHALSPLGRNVLKFLRTLE